MCALVYRETKRRKIQNSGTDTIEELNDLPETEKALAICERHVSTILFPIPGILILKVELLIFQFDQLSVNNKRSPQEKTIGPRKKRAREYKSHLSSAIKTVLGHKYLNIKKRLFLRKSIPCIKNREYCASHHYGSLCVPPNIYNASIAKIFIDQSIENCRYANFIKFVRDILMNNDFPGYNPLYKLLLLILTANPNKPESTVIITDCLSIFKQTLKQFPPCHESLKVEYSKMFTEMIKATEIDMPPGVTKFNPNSGILGSTITMLSYLLANQDNHDFNCFFISRHVNPEKADKSITRTDQIDRIFVVLYILTKIFEADLAVFALKHQKDTSEAFNSISDKPLIATILWPDNYTPGDITPLIKQIITVLVQSVILNFPHSKIEILSRLLNIIAHCCIMNETQCVPGEIEYPVASYVKLNPLIDVLIESVLLTTLRKKPLLSFLALLEAIRTPEVRMLLADRVTDLIYKSKEKLSCAKFIKRLKHDGMDKFELRGQFERDQAKNSKPSFTYNVLRKNRSNGKTDKKIYEEDYMYLLHIGLQSYFDVWQFKEVNKKISQNKRDPSVPESPPTTNNNFKWFEFLNETAGEVRYQILQQKIPHKSSSNVCCPYISVVEKTETFYRIEIANISQLSDYILELQKAYPNEAFLYIELDLLVKNIRLLN